MKDDEGLGGLRDVVGAGGDGALAGLRTFP